MQLKDLCCREVGTDGQSIASRSLRDNASEAFHHPRPPEFWTSRQQVLPPMTIGVWLVKRCRWRSFRRKVGKGRHRLVGLGGFSFRGKKEEAGASWGCFGCMGLKMRTIGRAQFVAIWLWLRLWLWGHSTSLPSETPDYRSCCNNHQGSIAALPRDRQATSYHRPKRRSPGGAGASVQ